MAKIIDPTATVGTETGVIGHPPVIFTPIHTHEHHGRSNTHLSLSLHTATHIDAPYHFDPNGVGIDRVPLERLVGPAVRIDLRARAKAKTAIGVADLRESPGFSEPLAEQIVVLHTGWNAAMFGRPNYDTENPSLATGTAAWLVKPRIRALALDHPQDQYEGPPRHGDFPVHRMVLTNGIPFIEHLDNLGAVDGHRFQLVTLPIKLRGADGAPARVIAILD